MRGARDIATPFQTLFLIEEAPGCGVEMLFLAILAVAWLLRFYPHSLGFLFLVSFIHFSAVHLNTEPQTHEANFLPLGYIPSASVGIPRLVRWGKK